MALEALEARKGLAELQHAHGVELQEVRVQLELDNLRKAAEWETEWKDSMGVLEGQLEETSAKYAQLREENDVLYNEVQDLKGAMRVFVRVRSLLETDSADTTCVDASGERKEVVVHCPKAGPKHFKFDKVFSEELSQVRR
mmetsp:Transcript_989/g.1737  ORF Transcript_989/g.1737 Transcript_989/m.1737 type:complete len:141 (-) Transcript_989:391-813(-)